MSPADRIDPSDEDAHHNLAALLDDLGDTDGAPEHVRLGAASGDTLAAQALRELEERLDDDDEE